MSKIRRKQKEKYSNIVIESYPSIFRWIGGTEQARKGWCFLKVIKNFTASFEQISKVDFLRRKSGWIFQAFISEPGMYPSLQWLYSTTKK